jgi:hypothetical protein
VTMGILHGHDEKHSAVGDEAFARISRPLQGTHDLKQTPRDRKGDKRVTLCGLRALYRHAIRRRPTFMFQFLIQALGEAELTNSGISAGSAPCRQRSELVKPPRRWLIRYSFTVRVPINVQNPVSHQERCRKVQ